MHHVTFVKPTHILTIYIFIKRQPPPLQQTTRTNVLTRTPVYTYTHTLTRTTAIHATRHTHTHTRVHKHGPYMDILYPAPVVGTFPRLMLTYAAQPSFCSANTSEKRHAHTKPAAFDRRGVPTNNMLLSVHPSRSLFSQAEILLLGERYQLVGELKRHLSTDLFPPFLLVPLLSRLLGLKRFLSLFTTLVHGPTGHIYNDCSVPLHSSVFLFVAPQLSLFPFCTSSPIYFRLFFLYFFPFLLTGSLSLNSLSPIFLSNDTRFQFHRSPISSFLTRTYRYPQIHTRILPRVVLHIHVHQPPLTRSSLVCECVCGSVFVCPLPSLVAAL